MTDMRAVHRAFREVDARLSAQQQVREAHRLVSTPEDEFLAFPWPALSTLCGNIPPGNIVLVGAFSGGGKTTFVSSIVRELIQQKKRVYVLPLETTPHHFRTYLACQQIGINPGDILTGEYYRWPNAEAVYNAVQEALQSQALPDMADHLYVNEQESINRTEMEAACKEAAQWGADLVIVDHIDQIEPEGHGNLWEESVRTVSSAWQAVRGHRLKMLMTSQLNNTATHGQNHLAKYQPPQVQHFYMGQHKIHKAAYTLGLFRPLRKPRSGETPEEYKAALTAAKNGDVEAYTALQPNTMGVVMCKSRPYGAREGARCFLEVINGTVHEPQHSALDNVAQRYGL